MRRDLTIKTGGLAGTSDFRVLAKIKSGFVPALDAVTYKTRVKRVLRALHIGRSDSHEHELFRVLSDAVERVGRIHSVGIVVLEPEDKVLLTVTFDGSWEAYVRVIWQKVTRLLDLVFCNTENYVVGYENSYEKWGEWLKSAQSEAAFLYATPNVTVDDIRYLKMSERVHRRAAADEAQLITTRIRIPSAEDIAARSIFESRGFVPGDPTSAGFEQKMTVEDAGKAPFRHGVRVLAGIHRLSDVYLPQTHDGDILLRAAHELLPEFAPMVAGATYQTGVQRAKRRFEEAVLWIQRKVEEPAVRQFLPNPLPDVPPLADPANIQGGILTPYPDIDHGCMLLVQFETPAAVAAFLGALQTTTEADTLAPGAIATNVGFTVEGLRMAGLADDEIRELPEEFLQGMAMRAGVLGDVRINHPQRWRLPIANWAEGVYAEEPGDSQETPRIDLNAVHAIVQLRRRASAESSDEDTPTARAPLMAAMKTLIAADEGVIPLSLQWMHRLRNANKVVEEHFGFTEGNSEPVLRKADAGRRYSNQIHLGEMLCGYPNLADKSDFYSGASERLHPLLKDGSFLAVRKLRQDVEAFETTLQSAVEAVGGQGANLGREDLMAKMLGRWPADHEKAGQPLATVIGADPLSNDFHFDKDPNGAMCPMHAHIRRTNPRFTQPESGQRPPRIARRGMSYGPLHNRAETDDAKKKESLAIERGLVFMAYNASLGEQFEVIQSWIAGANSSGSYSGVSDPLLGLAEPGKKRFYRFEHEGKVVHMPLDGEDRLHVEPRPFVRLEWGAYLFTPSIKALGLLKERAAARDLKPLLPWTVEAGEKTIAELREFERAHGAEAALEAWKAVLEDPDFAADYTSASVWAAIRENHGGLLRTPFGVLVADKDMVRDVFVDADEALTITGYLPRMHRSFGVLYLGLDPNQEDKAYETWSRACNEAIMAIDPHQAFLDARAAVLEALQTLADQEKADALYDHEKRWELTVESRELIEPLLAHFCEEWFGVTEKGRHFRRAGYRWDWTVEEPANYPGHFLSPSRYIFQPHPGRSVERYGAAHGQSVRSAMENYLTQFRNEITAPVSRAVLDCPEGANDIDFCAQTIAGAMMGFIPTVDGNLRRILNEWLRDGTLWKLRARYAGAPSKDFTEACNRLVGDFIPAFQLRAVPELIWRTAVTSTTLGAGEHLIRIKPGDVIVAGAVSATQQCLTEGSSEYHHAFGGNRRAKDHPTHACPGADPAVALMIGFFSALVETPLPLRPGPGPLTISADGAVLATPAVRRPVASARHFTAAAASDGTTPILVIGDSWLSDTAPYPSLRGALAERGYVDVFDQDFASLGRFLRDMADSAALDQIARFFDNIGPGEASPACIVLGGGGNDVCQPVSNIPLTALYRMTLDHGGQSGETLIEEQVAKFIDDELHGYLATVVEKLQQMTDIPILIHAYDHPIPNGSGFWLGGPWLKPIFDYRHMSDLATNTSVMKALIDRLNGAAARVAAANAQKVTHVNLTGTLAKDAGLWSNELHPTRDGYALLADRMATALQALGIGQPAVRA
ncbi:MAG TPA: GDSL-type esterase/lipase family protein [Rhodoblastus sp.]|nr:GDSL-type esterase/lipase family protein [Rhodoblastus sp.]